MTTDPRVETAAADLAAAIAELRRWDGEGASATPVDFARRLGTGEAMVRHLLRILDGGADDGRNL